MEIGHKIAQLRNLRKISQKKLAGDLNMSTGLVGLWETGKRVPSLENFVYLVDYFAVDANVLIEDDRVLRPGQYSNDLLGPSPAAEKLVNAFLQLSEDNQDILLGETKKLLKVQRAEEKVAASQTVPKKRT